MTADNSMFIAKIENGYEFRYNGTTYNSLDDLELTKKQIGGIKLALRKQNKYLSEGKTMIYELKCGRVYIV